MQRGVRFLVKDQCEDGAWFRGRWGRELRFTERAVCWRATRKTVSLNAKKGNIVSARWNWLKAVQKPDGSFGESLLSLRRTGDERAGKQHAFAKTAWGLIGFDGRSGCRRSGRLRKRRHGWCSSQKRRWFVEANPVSLHWHGFPVRFLSESITSIGIRFSCVWPWR